MKTIVLATGGFDPLRSRHLVYLWAARKLGDILVVGVHSDEWLSMKQKIPFMPLSERSTILRNIIGIDFIIDFDDSDGTASHAIWMTRQSYPQDKIIVASGCPRPSSLLEIDAHRNDKNLEFVFDVGCTINS